jgi:16S rRNA G966 N2-methylase RsmD
LISKLLNSEIQKFITDNESGDPHALSIKYKELEGVPFPLIAQQIASRKVAKSKLPTWYNKAGIIFPPKISMEQCSSDITAQYKANIVKGSSFIDLTGGAGVDTFAFAQNFERGTYVEQNKDLANITKHNLVALGLHNLEFVNQKAEDYLMSMPNKVDLIYLDPARRGSHQERVFLFSDCEPNVLEMSNDLLSKSSSVLIKASPMLDIDLSIKSLQYVKEVHIVSIQNECKEVLYLLNKDDTSGVNIYTINFKSDSKEIFTYLKSKEAVANANYSAPKAYLYEPNSSIMKAGAFQIISDSFQLNKLHQHTHLYTSDHLIEDFPGRKFKVDAVIPYDKKLIKRLIPEGKANVAVRNFKENVKMIRMKTGLRDGGEKYVFACTDLASKQIFVICSKVN